MREKLFPPNSRRRLIVELFLIALMNPGEFLQQLNKSNIKKFLFQFSVIEPFILKSKVRRKLSSTVFDKQSAGDVTFQTGELFGDIESIKCPKEKNHVLVVDRFVPLHDKDSGSMRMYSFLRILVELGYKVTFLPDDLQRTEPYTSELQAMGIEVLHGKIDIEKYLSKMGPIFSFVILSRPEQVFKYIPLIRAYALNSIILYDTIDLHWMRFERAASTTGKEEFSKKAREFKSIELLSASSSDVVLTITNDEKEILLKEDPGLKIEVIPNIHEVLEVYEPFQKRKDLMFIGGFLHQPNEDAVFYFVQEIFPLIKEKIKDIKFYVVGSDPSSDILRLNSDDIVVTGYKKDVLPYFKHSRIFVSPLRYGAGMKGKIGQSMAYGLPVVTTTTGAEGIGLVDGESALIADGTQAFADAVLRLYTDEMLWNKISRESVEHIKRNYSKEVMREKIKRIFEDLKEENLICADPEGETAGEREH
jgi:glycosyltransferase involved in cell wall biosynthesis